MEIIEKNIPYPSKSVITPDMFRIYPIGDIHAGSINCSENHIRQKVQEIKDMPDTYWIGMGDYADCILNNDKRFDIAGLATWVTKDNILETQRKWLRDLFDPIKDKCLGLLTGNHEESIHLHCQHDFTRNLCDDLGVPYAGYSAFFALTFDRDNTNESHQFIIHAWHGSGGAQTEGSRVMRLMRLVNEIGSARVYLMGHLHAISTYHCDRLTYYRGRVKSQTIAAAITGSWLKAYQQPRKGETLTPSYAEMKGYKPSVMGSPIVHIEPQTDKVSIEV